MRIRIIALLVGLLCWGNAQAQLTSDFRVRYMVTYDETGKRYTAWVVPEYDTPNSNNGATEETGSTAQLTLKVPRDFSLTALQDVKGVWEKNPTKIGTQVVFTGAGADPAFAYYIVGKAPLATNFGAFKQGEPVALFTFRSQSGTPSSISVLENDDPFIRIADQRMSLNVGSSFYSQSGQSTRRTAKPLEQFARGTQMAEVLSTMAQKVASQQSTLTESVVDQTVLAYPNPVTETLTVTYFSQQDNVPVRLEVVDLQGDVRQKVQQQAKLGFNTSQLTMTNYVGGLYILRTTVAGQLTTRKIVKQ